MLEKERRWGRTIQPRAARKGKRKVRQGSFRKIQRIGVGICKDLERMGTV